MSSQVIYGVKAGADTEGGARAVPPAPRRRRLLGVAFTAQLNLRFVESGRKSLKFPHNLLVISGNLTEITSHLTKLLRIWYEIRFGG